MNVVLLITITFTLALVRGNDEPCLRNDNDYAYDSFVEKHILQERFDVESFSAWESYIDKNDLCHRKLQSFFESSDQGNVEQICNGGGLPLQNGAKGNLCMSSSALPVYDVEVDNNCKVQIVKYGIKKVIVACDVVGNRCLPVHFEKYTSQVPDRTATPCQPA